MEPKTKKPNQKAGSAFYEIRLLPAKGRAGPLPLEIGHRAESGLRLLGHRSEDHGNVIARVLVAFAGNHHAGTVDLLAFGRSLEGDRHLCPFGKWRQAAEFDAIFVNDYSVRGQG